MSGNADLGNPTGQKVISPGASKVPNLDAMAAEKSKVTGPAKPEEKPISDVQNVVNGQRVF